MKRFRLGKARIKSQAAFDYFTMRYDLYLVTTLLKQTSDQLDLNFVGYAPISDNRSPTHKCRTLIRSNVSYPHNRGLL